MKKYILGSLLWVFTLFGAFASAWDFTIVWSSDSYTPNQITFTEDWFPIWELNSDDNNFDFVCPFNNCYIMFSDDLTSNFPNVNIQLYLVSWNPVVNNNWLRYIPAWTYYIRAWKEPMSDDYSPIFSSFVFKWISDNNAWWDNSWSLLPWGESDLSWIISWLSDTINEFIPYLVYLGLWIITALIWFVAIRWLINRTSSKVRWTFSSWRRRR